MTYDEALQRTCKILRKRAITLAEFVCDNPRYKIEEWNDPDFGGPWERWSVTLQDIRICSHAYANDLSLVVDEEKIRMGAQVALGKYLQGLQVASRIHSMPMLEAWSLRSHLSMEQLDAENCYDGFIEDAVEDVWCVVRRLKQLDKAPAKCDS